jgi:nicotinamidase-related amidase
LIYMNSLFRAGQSPWRNCIKPIRVHWGEHAYAAIEPTKRLFAAARAAGLPVFYTTQDIRPESRPGRVIATRLQDAIPDPSLYAIKSEFKPQPGDVVIAKQRASAYYGTPLMAHLTQLGVRTVVGII